MNITRGVTAKAQKVVIYGVEGIGKSSLAARFPNPLFIDTEGSTSNMDVARLDSPSSWTMINNQIAWVKANPTVCQTLIIDTADWAERMAIEQILMTGQKTSITQFGYGEGFIQLEEEFGRFLNKLTDLIEIGINVVITAHAKIVKFEQPDEMGAYDRYELKLGNKTTAKTASLLKEWADMVLFINYKTQVVATDKDGKKHKAQGGQRVMHTQHHPAWDAKNRHGLPAELPLDFNAIAHVFNQQPVQVPAPVAPPTQPVPEPVIETAPQQPVQDPVQAPVAPTPTTAPPSNLPQALLDLMLPAGVTEEEIRLAVSGKGYFPHDMAVADYPQDFIQGVLIGAWPQILKVIEEDRALPF